MENNWALFIDQCWLQALHFLVHLIDLLSILLRRNACTWIQKAVVDQTDRRPPNNDHDICFGTSSGIPLDTPTELVTASCWIKI